MNDVEPRRLALRYSPPAIIVEYERHSALKSPTPQLYHHEIDLSSQFQSHSSHSSLHISEMVRQITKEHGSVLSNVSAEQINRLIHKLATSKSSMMKSSETRDIPIETQQSVVLPQADYNRVSENQLKQVKQKMDAVFHQNIVKPGDVGYQYDKQVKFTPTAEASDWDD